MTQKKLVLGNLKMNGSLSYTESLLQSFHAQMPLIGCDVGFCVPHPYLGLAHRLLAGSAVSIGAQDCSPHAAGAYTGEVSATMLKDFGVRYVLCGHSERRQYHRETDQLVAQKAQAALAEGITPVICVGETHEQHQQGLTDAVIKQQISAVIHQLGRCVSEVVISYEPVWAIGTGNIASSQQVHQIHDLLRVLLAAATPHASRVKLLYGGSINARNAATFFKDYDIDGGLVGAASLSAQDFSAVCMAASGSN